jgi:membrane protein involved in colicin uptake
MARKSLRPQLNQIRAWVRQGRTDAWVAHQLEVTVQEIEQFKHQNELAGGEDVAEGVTTVDYPEEIDLRAEDDALIAAELEEAARKAEEEAKAREEAEAAEEAERKARRASGRDDGTSDDGDEDEDEPPRTRRRGRRGGRTRRGAAREAGPLEGTFDHGEEGYGLWLDPAVQDNPIYAEHWAGHRPVEVVVEEEQIVIRRTGEDD